MGYMIIFRSDEGRTGYHQADTLDDATTFLERLRNHEGIEQVNLYRLEEVPFEFRTYFKVEVPGSTPIGPAAPAAPTVSDEPEPAGDVAALPVEPELVVEGAGANGRKSLFGR